MQIKVIHAKRSALKLPKDEVVYLDRTIGKSKLANQWTHLPVGRTKAQFQTKTVEEAVQCYDQWLKNTVNSEINKSDKPIGSSLRILFSLGTRLHAQGKTLHLACWCKDELEPKPYDHVCHCDVIKRVLLARFKKQSQT